MKFSMDLTGKEVVVVGRSNIVGKPVALLCLQKHATITIAHSRTKDLKDICRRAECFDCCNRSTTLFYKRIY